MTLQELITDLKAAGANENTMQLAMNCYELGLANAQREPLAQPEQAPMVTKNEKGLTLHVGWDDLPAGTKLYTSPPQRQPLTEEEILKCFAESDGTFISSGRAIEAAHGIGDKT